MSQPEKSSSVKAIKTATMKTNKIEKSGNPKQKKETKSSQDSNKAEAAGEDKKLTQGQKLLKALTAQKAAKQALMKGVKKTHVTFDEEGNEANVETVVQKSLKNVTTASSDDKKPAAKKKAQEQQQSKKRKADEIVDKTDIDDKIEQEDNDNDNDKKKKKQPKKPKKSKKEKKEKKQAEEDDKKESRQEEALAYVRLFVQDRASWKFKKLLQTWLLQNLYKIPENEFDNVLIYLKDIQGAARENTKKEAEGKIAAARPKNDSSTAVSLNNGYDDNDDDDFDAEKLLAMASGAAAPAPAQQQQHYESSENDSDEVKRAKLISKTLS